MYEPIKRAITTDRLKPLEEAIEAGWTMRSHRGVGS